VEEWEAALRAAIVATVKRRIALCLPGTTFSAPVLLNTMQLLTYMGQLGFSVEIFNAYCSNAAITRQRIANGIVSDGSFDYALWVDDDNILTPQMFKMLLDDLEALPVDAVFGWCQCGSDSHVAPTEKPSVGMLDAQDRCVSHSSKDLQEANGLVDIDWSGFPAVLMRVDVLTALGKNAFTPIVRERNADKDADSMLYGEDVSFCIRAKQAGFKLAADPRVCVPHMKLRNINNDLLQQPSSVTAAWYRDNDGNLKKEGVI
jgi:hypothetical protein